jgi:hypothetical protein
LTQRGVSQDSHGQIFIAFPPPSPDFAGGNLPIFYHSWENRKRDRGERGNRLQEEDEASLGYRHP